MFLRSDYFFERFYAEKLSLQICCFQHVNPNSQKCASSVKKTVLLLCTLWLLHCSKWQWLFCCNAFGKFISVCSQLRG